MSANRSSFRCQKVLQASRQHCSSNNTPLPRVFFSAPYLFYSTHNTTSPNSPEPCLAAGSAAALPSAGAPPLPDATPRSSTTTAFSPSALSPPCKPQRSLAVRKQHRGKGSSHRNHKEQAKCKRRNVHDEITGAKADHKYFDQLLGT